MLFKEIAEIIDQQGTAALCILVQTKGSTPRQAGSKMLVFPDGRISGTIGGGEMEHRVVQEALDAIQVGKPRLISYKMTDPQDGDPGLCGGQLEVYVEPILPKKAVIVVGAGHVGQAVAKLAKWLGYYLIISDDRPDFAVPDRVPDADVYHTGPMGELIESQQIHNQSNLVLTTRGVDLDSAGLPAMLATEAAYIGVIGSKRRWETTRKMLLESGIPVEQISRIHSPMGLELHAETPEEIAVSILAEIIMLSKGGDGKEMKSG
ncbi:MAG: XdhC family protein [Chloroflexota bacterium]